MNMAPARMAVVGHAEWIEFLRVDSVPLPGEIVTATETWEEPAGGGGVAAVELARLAGSSTLFCLLGADELGGRARRRLEEASVQIHSGRTEHPQRRGYCFLDERGERTI